MEEVVVYCLVVVLKWPFSPNASLLSKFNPRDIIYMHPKGTSTRSLGDSCGAPSVKFIERLDLEEKISFMDRHWLGGLA